MNAHQYLYAVLSEHADMQEVFDGRIYPDEIDQEAELPAMRLVQVGQDDDQDLQGNTQVSVRRFQVDIVGKTKDEAEDAALEVKAVLEDAEGARGGFQVQAIFFRNSVTVPEPDSAGILVTQDWEIHVAGEES